MQSLNQETKWSGLKYSVYISSREEGYFVEFISHEYPRDKHKIIRDNEIDI